MGDREGQRYFKVTPKGRAPKVHLEWPAEEEIEWYYAYFMHVILVLIAIPVAMARKDVRDDGWLALILDAILIWIFLAVILPPKKHWRK